MVKLIFHYTTDCQLSDSKSSALKVLDRRGRLFLYRAFPARFLQEGAEKFARIHNLLIGPSLAQPSIQKHHVDGDCGDHLPLIIGHWRQSSQVFNSLPLSEMIMISD